MHFFANLFLEETNPELELISQLYHTSEASLRVTYSSIQIYIHFVKYQYAKMYDY